MVVRQSKQLRTLITTAEERNLRLWRKPLPPQSIKPLRPELRPLAWVGFPAEPFIWAVTIAICLMLRRCIR